MNHLKDKIFELQEKLQFINNEWKPEIVSEVYSKLLLYIEKYFPENRPSFLKTIDSISLSFDNESDYYLAIRELNNALSTILEYIELESIEGSNFQSEYKETLKEIEKERDNIQKEANEIKSLREKLNSEQARISEEEKKFNVFKSKLELADKNIDFQLVAKKNRNSAIIWLVIGIALLIFIIISVHSYSKDFSLVSSVFKSEDLTQVKPFNENLKSETINFYYIIIFKAITLKIFYLSLLIFAVKKCFSNYSSLMHNYIINSHKSNALKSTLSLLDTAKTEDGNDKLLVQATQAIYSHQQTGYEKNKEGSTEKSEINTVIESIVKK
ncbi:hypothetical protein CW731_05795 [Polaribacter sp. ALD11]|uniref:hypothetical protein n=1 Tax=Polaribacter sp. ALD11 TaxID=2058137 RepID=UPI000C304764|nr:hypothetical protein [Polaribacter sp. ALD11]AUC84835.1 hypothetical protein CW731_05795 [Polaribacter sp. ALD11]